MSKSAFLSIGRITKPHGIRGILSVHSYVESLSLFAPDEPILLTHPDGWEKTCEIEWIRPHKRALLLSLKGVESRGAAEALIGGEFQIERTALPDPEEDTYYWSDLVGLSVFTTDDTYVGRLEAIIPTGSNDVYVVREKTQETLVPALTSVVTSVDIEKGIMRVELPEGL